jgi:endonuclease/exonuclease/phosphatase family metal-dependent hydrolase
MTLIWISIGSAILILLITGRRGSRVAGQQGESIRPLNLDNEQNSVLRIASLNIQYGRGEDQQLDLQRTASILGDCDFVALQEVSGKRSLNQPNQAAALGSILNMAWIFAPTKTRWFKPYVGNGALTNVAVHRWFWRSLIQYRGRSFRNMIICEIELLGKKVTIINTHLHTHEGRDEQMKQIFRELAKYRRAVLLGDFNTRPQNVLLQELIRKSAVHDPFANTLDTTLSNARVDWILLKGLVATDVSIIEPSVSDHPALLATLALQSS